MKTYTEREVKSICENLIKQIQHGEGINRSEFPEEMKGTLAIKYWEDGVFSLGMEYGIIFGALEISKRLKG